MLAMCMMSCLRHIGTGRTPFEGKKRYLSRGIIVENLSRYEYEPGAELKDVILVEVLIYAPGMV